MRGVKDHPKSLCRHCLGIGMRNCDRGRPSRTSLFSEPGSVLARWLVRKSARFPSIVERGAGKALPHPIGSVAGYVCTVRIEGNDPRPAVESPD